ncbi:hypothetical protein Tco_0784318, partial [Tanacetum coccineum]
DILQICPKVDNKKFEEPPLEKEIPAFLASLGHSGDIRKITDVNVNKLHTLTLLNRLMEILNAIRLLDDALVASLA